MYDLTKDEKLKFIIEKSEELGITSYEYGQNTSISDLGARNILTGESKNPRTKNLNIMLEYLMKKVTGTKLAVAEPTDEYSKKAVILDQLKTIETAVQKIKSLI